MIKEKRDLRAKKRYYQFVRNPRYMTDEEIRIEKRQGLLIMMFFIALCLFMLWSVVYFLLHGYPFA